MTAQIVPTGAEFPSFLQRVSLDGEFYQLRIRWNSRASAWFADLYDDEENPILMSRRLTIDSPFFSFHRNRAVPPGELMIFDTSNRKEQAGLDELGDRVIALYLEAVDIA